MPTVKPLRAMGCPLGGATNSGLPGLDRGRVGQQSLKVAERSHGLFLHDELQNLVMFTCRSQSNNEKKAKTHPPA